MVDIKQSVIYLMIYFVGTASIICFTGEITSASGAIYKDQNHLGVLKIEISKIVRFVYLHFDPPGARF